MPQLAEVHEVAVIKRVFGSLAVVELNRTVGFHHATVEIEHGSLTVCGGGRYCAPSEFRLVRHLVMRRTVVFVNIEAVQTGDFASV